MNDANLLDPLTISRCHDRRSRGLQGKLPHLCAALLWLSMASLALVMATPTHAEAKSRVKNHRRHSKKSSKNAVKSGHKLKNGPGWWIHREGDKPLGWLFGKQLNEARKHKQSVIVMFTADWCSPCKSIKEFVAGSAVVRAAFRKHKGRLLYIDVDEWRGPAHRLIPGLVPRKLPTLVRIDGGGQQVMVVYGSQLGLLSEDAIAKNFGLLIDAKPLVKPFYEGDSKKQSALIVAQHRAREARNNKTQELVVTRTGRGKVRLRIRNLGGPRRWYLIPVKARQKLVVAPRVGTVTTMKFDEHVRATYLRFDGAQPCIAVPVAGYGDVDLIDWPLAGGSKTLEVWQLNRLEVDGVSQQFDRKLPYHQTMKRSSAARVLHSRPAKSVRMVVKRKLSVVFK